MTTNHLNITQVRDNAESQHLLQCCDTWFKVRKSLYKSHNSYVQSSLCLSIQPSVWMTTGKNHYPPPPPFQRSFSRWTWRRQLPHWLSSSICSRRGPFETAGFKSREESVQNPGPVMHQANGVKARKETTTEKCQLSKTGKRIAVQQKGYRSMESWTFCSKGRME